MPRLYNVDHQPLVVHPAVSAIQPGESFDFSDEQIAAGIGGLWSTTPGGPDAAEVKKAATKGRQAVKQATEPAQPEKEKED